MDEWNIFTVEVNVYNVKCTKYDVNKKTLFATLINLNINKYIYILLIYFQLIKWLQ